MHHVLPSQAPTDTDPGTRQPVKLCIHGHFYQPPREDPFSGSIPQEPGASPYANFNEKILAECYRPLAQAGTFALMSFNIGPTLFSWMEQTHPDVYQRIIEGDRLHLQRYGVGNAMAQPYNHTILPLANARDKRTQILWGLQDFNHRYVHPAQGMWLPETAVDIETLDVMAQCGVRYTILAPWQFAHQVDPTEPYLISLRNGRSIAAFAYNDLSGAVSYDDGWTQDANEFAKSYMQMYRNQTKGDQMHLIASDGELYGHHKFGRNMFLDHLLRYSAPAFGFEACTLERYLLEHPPTKEAWICEPSSWSCRWHGVARWEIGCGCTEGDSSWKPELRRALTNLSDRGSLLFEQHTKSLLRDCWAARDEYLLLRNGWVDAEQFWKKHARSRLSRDDTRKAHLLLESQFYFQYGFTSCGFFFEDVDRIEPRNNIGFARRAISLVWQALHIDLQPPFVHDLARAVSWRTHLTGADLYRQLPPLSAEWLPREN